MSQLGTEITVREDVCIESKPEPCGVVIFGASGDLSHRKLIPALFSLYQRELTPSAFYEVGMALASGCAVRGVEPTVTARQLGMGSNRFHASSENS